MPIDLPGIKRAPRWAFFVVGGIALGAVVVRLWQGRATDAEGETQAGLDEGGEQARYPGAPGTGVIVPPVVLTPPSADITGGGFTELFALFGDLITGQSEQWEAIYGPIAGLLPDIVLTPDKYRDIIGGGGAPTTPAPALPPVVVVQPPPAPAPAPAPVPTPAPPAPGPAPCPAAYPHRSARGCYKWVCASGRGSHARGEWHYYPDGAEIHVNSNPC